MDEASSCAQCGSPLQDDQRYCLLCGARAGAADPLLVELQRRMGPEQGRPDAPVGHSLDAAAVAPPSPGLRLPQAKVSALLVLLFLGFGALLGGVAGSPVSDTLAASRAPRLKLVLPSTASASAAGNGASTSSAAETTPPPVEEEETPAESESTSTPVAGSTPTKTTASTNSGSSKKEAGSSTPEEGGGGSAPTPATKLPPIKHVFVIMLSDEPYAALFGPESKAHYLSGTLEHRGTLLVRYDAVAHEELANEIALISGQGPTQETAANCPTYADLTPAGTGAAEQVLGNGCVYPASTPTLASELTGKHLTWRAYAEGTDEGEPGAPACAHPVLGQPDPLADQTASSGPYATFRNPFLYFHSTIDTSACASENVGMNQLRVDLSSSAMHTPNLVYIIPDRCHDANPTPCTTGAPSGPATADAFLQRVIPEITESKAYKQDGLIAITTDEAPSSGEFADSSACCGQPTFPNLPPSATPGLSPRGGGTVGALLLSPYLKGATTNQEPFNHFSLLATIDRLFGLKRIGYAALPAVKPFEAGMFSSSKLP